MPALTPVRVARAHLVSRMSWRASLALLAFVAAACGGGDSSSGPDAPSVGDITVAVSPTPLIIRQGLSGTATVTITRARSSKALVTLVVAGQPDGVTATLDPGSLSGTQVSSTLTVTAAMNAPTGISHITVTPSVGGVSGASAFVDLNVYAPRLTVTRAGTGSGTVTSNPAGINCGGTCVAPFEPQSTVTLTATPLANSVFAGWSGLCTGTAATCTLTSFIGGSVTATFDSAAPSFALAVTPARVSMEQGATAAAHVSIARANGFAGAVSLAVSGAPSGLTITPSPGSVTDTASTLNISASLSVAAANYPVTITATGAGVAQQTTMLNVQVTPAPGGTGSVTFSFARCEPSQVPIWFAVQNGGGAWTRVNAGAGNTFTIATGASGVGIAYVMQDRTQFDTRIRYGSPAEIVALAVGNPCAAVTNDPPTGTKRVNVTLANTGAPGKAYSTVVIGGASFTQQPAQGPNFSLTDVPSGTRDLIATRAVYNANGTSAIQRLILRRDVAYANNANVPLLDLGGTESIVPVGHFFGLPNLGSDLARIEVGLVTANGTTAPYDTTSGFVNQNINKSFVFYGAFPDSILRPGDLHGILITAASDADPTSARFIYMLRHSGGPPVPVDVDFGSSLSTPTVANLGDAPYLRLRTQLPSQREYGAAVLADFDQPDHSVSVEASAAYAGGTPASWTVDIPDLSSAGYDPAWGLRAGTGVDWFVVGVGGDVLAFTGGTPVDGAQLLLGIRSSSSTVFSRVSRSLGVPWLRRP